MTIIRKKEITNIVENVEKLEPLQIAGGNIKWWSNYRKKFGGSSKN